MADFVFYLFAFLTVLAAAGVVVNRNAINAALCLLLSFVGMAALFVLLEAYFLALLQVLVYAGAVVVLFLFIIMLFDVQGGDPRKPYRKIAAASGLVALALLVIGVLSLAHHGPPANPDPALLAGPLPAGASLKSFGYLLFTTYLLPMQVTGFLLLVAMLGVTVLSRKFDAGEGTP
ncbi:MAG: NADH-quinone oxidoreductase subunit J [Opitutaceae bacterium]|nr:NADH-quinone oxidoreductase subunit J [Opitutaceae bacterium]